MYLYINIYLVDIYVGIVSSTHAWSICTRVRTVSLELYFVRACLNMLLAIRIDRVVVVHPCLVCRDADSSKQQLACVDRYDVLLQLDRRAGRPACTCIDACCRFFLGRPAGYL